MRILGVLRGRPGAGHIIPGLALLEWCAAAGHVVAVATYENGVQLLRGQVGFPVHDLELNRPYHAWAGLNVIDDLCLKLPQVVSQFNPDVVLCGGEYLLPIEGKRWGRKLCMIYNPELFTVDPHNDAFRALFLETFSRCDLLICQAPPPEPSQLAPESVSLVDRSVYFGPLLRPFKDPDADCDGRRSVLVSNGGGTSFPETSATYSSKASIIREWREQNYEYTLGILNSLADLPQLDVHAFVCMSPEENRSIEQTFSRFKHITVYSYSLRYHTLLADSDLIICRAGAAAVSEVLAFGRSALLWPLRHHAEQERTVRETEARVPWVTGIWNASDLGDRVRQAAHEVMSRPRLRSPVASTHRNGMASYVKRLESLCVQ